MENEQKPVTIVGDLKSKFKFSPKVIFALLALILVIELIYAVRTLTVPPPVPSPTVSTTSSTKSEANIKLASSSYEYSVGETVSVLVLIDTGGRETVGVDAILHFDPKVLEATNSSLEKGTIFQDYPALSVDDKSGKISISGIVLPGSQANFKGSGGTFAIVKFKAKAAGKTEVKIDFLKGSTTDSNIVESASSQDILEKVEELSLTIR